MEGRDTEDSWGDRVTQTTRHPVWWILSSHHIMNTLCQPEIMYAGGAAQSLNWFMSLPK